jgi:hypothetical protein
MGRSSFLRLPTRSSSQRSRSGQRRSGNVTGAAGEFQHRTGHPPLFARREAQVILLDAVAGSPPTAATLLIRHADGQSLDDLEHLLREWQQWCADLLESQISYAMLAYYRSQHDNQSWLAALTAVMDVCVLLMVGFKGLRTFRARLTFSIAPPNCGGNGQSVPGGGSSFQRGPTFVPTVCSIERNARRSRTAVRRREHGRADINGFSEHVRAISERPC